MGFMFQIESGVEIPPQSQPLRKMKYPFNRLNVGDSFVFPVGADEDREAIQNRLQSAAANCCLLYTSPSPRDYAASRMPSSA